MTDITCTYNLKGRSCSCQGSLGSDRPAPAPPAAPTAHGGSRACRSETDGGLVEVSCECVFARLTTPRPASRSLSAPGQPAQTFSSAGIAASPTVRFLRQSASDGSLGEAASVLATPLREKRAFRECEGFSWQG